jgi:hypothetical protein
MFEKHIKDLIVAFDLSGWYELYMNRELKQLMIEYSRLNYGHKNCNLAFSDEPV